MVLTPQYKSNWEELVVLIENINNPRLEAGVGSVNVMLPKFLCNLFQATDVSAG